MGYSNGGTCAGAATSWTVVMVELGQLPVTSMDGSNGGTWAVAVTSMEGGNNASPSCSVTAPGRSTRSGTTALC